MSTKTSFTLTQADIPTHWYNMHGGCAQTVAAAVAPGHQTADHAGHDDGDFPGEPRDAGDAPERWVEIPEPVREIYALWRPTPLLRAVRLEKALQTPAHIYYKYEGDSPAGSHKPNTAVAQAYYNKQAGTKRLATETGAGQWGSALALAASCSGWNAASTWSRSASPETVSQTADADVGRDGVSQSERPDRVRPQDAEGGARLPRQPRHRHQRSHRGHRQAPRHEVFARQRAQPRLHAPDRHRPGSHQTDGTGGRGTGRGHRLRRRRQQLCRHRVPVRPQENRREEDVGSSPSSRPCAPR